MDYTITLTSGNKTHTTFSNKSLLDGAYSQVFILIHGFPDDNTSFNQVGAGLNQSFPNALILSPLLRGYEPSSYHEFQNYKTGDLALDIKNWIHDIQVKTGSKSAQFTLIGHDWGAIAAMKAASLYPEIIHTIVSLAIPYVINVRPYQILWHCPEQIYYSTYFLTMQSKYLYSKLKQIGSDSYLTKLWQYWSPTWKFDNDDTLHVSQTLTTGNNLDHITAYYRCLLRLRNFSHRKWLIDFNKVPTYFLGGDKDGCMSYRLYNLEKEILKNEPNATVELIPGLGHFLHREDPTVVCKHLTDWIKQH